MTPFLCRLRSIAAHRDHFVGHLSVSVSVCLSGSHTLVVTQATHAFIRMLSLCLRERNIMTSLFSTSLFVPSLRYMKNGQ